MNSTSGGDSPQGSTNSNETDSKDKEVSLGPACLVVFVICALVLSVAMITASWMVMGNQGPMAARAISKQMIPWIEQSSLEPVDRDAIIRELNDVVEDILANRLDERQMVRLKVRIADSPVLQWGVIQQLEARIRESGLTTQEKESAEIELDRMLRSAAEGKLAIEQMEFIIQKVASKERVSGRLSVLPTTDDVSLREFLRRAKSLSDNSRIPDEPYPKSPAQAFHGLIEDALSAK